MSGLVLAALGAGGAMAGDYSEAVQADRPLAYYRLNDRHSGVLLANLGSLGAAGRATHLNVKPVGGGAVAGVYDPAAFHDGSGARTLIPFNAALNPAATADFTIEAWVNTSVEVTDAPGPAPLMNRYSYPGANRQGWVFFQRSPGTGWNFRTYTGQGSSTGVNITGQSSHAWAGQAGTWNHLVVAWEGATSTATLFVNGEQVAQGGGGYQANTDDHPASEAPNGAAGLAIGAYNNTQPGENPFHGKVDEVAFYHRRLTAAQVLAHYQNATNPARTRSYESLVLADQPVEYLRFEDLRATRDQAVNLGRLKGAGDATNTVGVIHPAGGLAGGGDAAFGYRARNGGGGVATLVPWNAALNPEVSSSFTIESWFYVGQEVTDSPGPAPIMNRYSYPGANRQGWVYFQRSPGTGWNFRTYTGQGSSTGVNITGQSSHEWAGQAGTWNHVVTVWDGPGATATLYVNGEQVAQGGGGYQPNTDDHPAEQAVRGPSALAIGSYNNTQPGENPYHGRVDEVAFYDVALTADQVLAHFQTGTNSSRTVSYEAAVLADQPVEYLRLDDPAFAPAANSGSLGSAAAAALIFTDNAAPGPRPPLAGFEPDNTAARFDGANGFATIGNPAGLRLGGPVTLEAWVRPEAIQPARANLVARATADGTDDALYLRLVDGNTYAVGSWDGATAYGATFAIPAGDLGGADWVHLAGTYDGSRWSLYRNGTLVGSANATVGAVASAEGDWAIGARGTGATDVLAGTVDEVAVYHTALSAARIAAHYDAARGPVIPPPPPSVAIRRNA
ncbi:MAG: LamG domain-containing protein, partial [Verrucomicrobiota bacterium]